MNINIIKMGNIIKNGKEVKSNLFSCTGCSDEKNLCISPKTYTDVKVGETNSYNDKNINYFNTPDMQLNQDKFFRSFSSVNKDKASKKIKIKNYPTNFKEENINKFNIEKYESNPKIIELISLLGKNNNFVLTEKESFYIKDMVSKNNLIKKLLHYKDDCYYFGFIDKNNNNKELFGTYYYNDGSIYKGFFENDKIKGRGRLIVINRYIYEGYFEDGLFNGYGKLYTINGIIYEGYWKNDMQNGFGEEKYSNGSSYSGTFQKGIKHGKGKLVFKNGDIYEGDFENDEMTGYGVLRRKDGKIYSGMVKNHLIEGIGIFIWKDNKRYIGEYHNELKDGFGIFYTNDGRNYAGFWKEGKQNGFGVITNVYGQKYYIKYNNGEKVQGIIFSDKEKEDIDNLIIKEEKRIDKNKLNKIAEELMLQREKEKEKEKKGFIKINKKDNNIKINDKEKNKNPFIIISSNISNNNNLNLINTNISIPQNELKIINNKKDDLLSGVTNSNFVNSLFFETGTSFNKTKTSKNVVNKKNYKSSSSKDGDRNTNQTSNSTNNERNKSFPNLNVFYSKNFKKDKIMVEINNFESCRLEHSEKMYN